MFFRKYFLKLYISKYILQSHFSENIPQNTIYCEKYFLISIFEKYFLKPKLTIAGLTFSYFFEIDDVDV